MTSKRDLRAMVERLTAQLNMAKDERDRTALILEQMYDLETIRLHGLHQEVDVTGDTASGCRLPAEVVRAVVVNSDRPEAMHLELTAGWLRHLGADVIDVQDSFIHFTASVGGRWWELHAIDEGGYLNHGLYAARFHEYSLHSGPMMEPVWIDGGYRPAELAGRALWHARQIEGQR